MPIGAVVGGVAAGVGGSVISSSATKKASKKAQQTADTNNALQQQIYQENEKTLSPYVASGNSAGTAINSLLGLSGDPSAQTNAFNAFRNSDGYQFRLNEGLKSTEAALGAKGLLDSGAALKSLNNYAQGQASSEFGNYFAALQGQQQTGLSAAAAQAGVGTGYANAVSANNNNAASATGNAALANASILNSTLNNGVKALSSSYGQNAALTGFDGSGSYGAALGGVY